MGLYGGFPGDSVVKNLPVSAGATGGSGSIPWLGRYPGGGNSKLLQCSFFFFFNLFIWLCQVLVAVCGIFN